MANNQVLKELEIAHKTPHSVSEKSILIKSLIIWIPKKLS